MPHSSGGGSHSSGSHSSSSSSSTSRSSSSGRGYSSPAYIHRYTHTNPYGYVNYHSGGTPEYCFFEKPKSYYTKQLKIAIALFVVITIVATAIFYAFSIKKPIENNEGSCQIIANNSSVGSLSQLQPILNEFKEKTGINVYIVTENNDWKVNYSQCENFAYDLYVHNFKDNEKNWLIVYTQDSKLSLDMVNADTTEYLYNSNFVDWYWEGMQGDETDKILDQKVLNKFNQNLQRGLTYANGDPKLIEQAFFDAFSLLNSTVMQPNYEDGSVVLQLAAMLMLFTFVPVFISIISELHNYKNVTEIPASSMSHGKPIEDKCDYCGSVYVIGTVTRCPSCGAVLNPHYEDGTRI